MNFNGEIESTDDSVICLNVSQDASPNDNDVIIDDLSAVNINFSKILQPGTAPEGIIILDESINPTQVEIDGKSIESTQELEEPIIKVIFQNEAVACQYRKKVRDFLQNLLSTNLTDESSDCSDLILEIKQSHIRSTCDSPLMIIEDQSLFTIDSTPGRHDKYNVPTYGKKFDRVLTESRDESTKENDDDKAPKLTCFNCSGNHNLRDCSEPKNQAQINKNRKEFMQKSGPRNVRYHVDQKFIPGILSTELKSALGLGINELPKHIYKMRLMGYPPGWLEEAKLQHSGLNLYNSDGLREVDPKEELGEIFCPDILAEYDINKIYDFPGFNVSPPDGTRDAYWSADQQSLHSKEAMLQMLSPQMAEEGYKRKKFKRSHEASSDAIIEAVHMDIDALEDTPVESVLISDHYISSDPKSPRSPGELSNSPSQDTDSLDKTLPLPKDDCPESLNSPSLIELENRKKLLLQELNDSTLSSNPGTPKATINCNTETYYAESPSTSSHYLSSENILKVGAVKSVELGTPLIESTSLYTKLPSSDKFSKDISDVINFENLPGATGTYEKMSGLIQKIRTTLTPQKY